MNYSHFFISLNTEHPIDYKARSLSVSDVVDICDEQKSKFYFVDRFGCKKIDFDVSKLVTKAFKISNKYCNIKKD